MRGAKQHAGCAKTRMMRRAVFFQAKTELILYTAITLHGYNDTFVWLTICKGTANMSARLKSGKKVNVQKRKVPNIVFGYDKIIGKYFDLIINEKEAFIIEPAIQKYNGDHYLHGMLYCGLCYLADEQAGRKDQTQG